MWTKIIALILCAAGVAFGILLCYASVRWISRSVRKSLWSTAAGTVTDIHMTQHADSDGNTFYEDRISYEFESGGARYASKGVRRQARETDYTLLEHPIGSKVIVHFLRSKPSVSQLWPPSIEFRQIALGIGGLACILVCANLIRVTVAELAG